jgi:CHAD domain-containing protein
MKLVSVRDRLLRRRLRAFARALPEARSGDPAGVHKARVASRRMREALPVVLADVPARKMKRAVRDFRRVTRALGPVRELDVTLGVLREAGAADPDAAASLRIVARVIETERDQRRQEMLGRLERVDAERVAARVVSLAEPASHVGPALAEPVSRAVLAVRIVRRVRELEQADAAVGALYSPEPLHRVRIATKKLRYAMELAHELRQLPSRKAVRLLERMQDTLGRMHDLQVLLDRLAVVQADSPEWTPAAAGDLSRVAHALDDECRRLHAVYVVERAPLLASVASALDVVTAARVRDVETEPVSPSVH